ncbi:MULTISPECIES: acetylglutamate kinase [Bacillus]|uniref:Acetylglutamate kinase n=1 Tax=Bacillus mycoides TaxID=1405 RepID=A0A1E8BMZ2_BACMY|nr:acetylglutamate kinase [Bacillus mycoides]OFD42394.1 acetylglutamate kinase [Bacillus mycoides]OFD46188.1 acetylglutamate kinase [Bacillus mycoides]OFD92883.1 acetylglutamate kinase [Bacillus mycoides]OFE00533.1 acetylglutamate kinase [Bacillus mycoides]
MYTYWQSYYSPYHINNGNFDSFVRNYRVSKNENFLKGYMRSLWEQHVTWTRLAIIGIIFNLPDVNVTVGRLLQNATHMGLSLEPFYGENAVKKYSALIKDHLVIAADLVKAAKAGDQNAVAAIEKKWYANGDEIVEFLTSINPYIEKEEFRKMFYEHLALTKAEALAFLNKDYDASVKLYDKIEKEALEMADTITDAIVKQFPQVFQ